MTEADLFDPEPYNWVSNVKRISKVCEQYALAFGTQPLQLESKKHYRKTEQGKQALTRHTLLHQDQVIAHHDTPWRTEPDPLSNLTFFQQLPVWLNQLNQLLTRSEQAHWHVQADFQEPVVQATLERVEDTLKSSFYKQHHSYTQIVHLPTEQVLWTYKNNALLERLIEASYELPFLLYQWRRYREWSFQQALGA